MKRIFYHHAKFAAVLFVSALALVSCGDPEPEPGPGKTLESIAVTTPPAKMSYIVGEAFDPAGMVVTATYRDDSTAPVTVGSDNFTYDFSTAGTGKSVTIAYEGKTTNLGGITVAAPEPTGTLRYETVPFGTEPDYVVPTRAATGHSMLVYSAYDDDNYYYVFLLGHVNHVPIAYRDAIYYDGVTPITVAYNRTSATEESIRQSVGACVENTVSNSSSLSVSVSYGIFGLGAEVGSQFSWQDSQSRSTSSTYETTQTIVNEDNFGITATIGDHGQPVGKYRYSLFATADVFYVLTLARTDRRFVEAEIAVCARPETTAWGIDYEPKTDGTFEKTAEGELLEIPTLNYGTLPTPTNEIEGPPVVELKTVYTRTITESRSMSETGEAAWNDYITADLDIARLREEGYTYVTISVGFRFENTKNLSMILPVIAGVAVRSGHGDNGAEWGSTAGMARYPYVGWTDVGPVTIIEQLPLAQFSNEFTLGWGTIRVTTLGERSVTVEAKK